MIPFLVTSGEPAGIGPDLCLSLADLPYPLVVLGDKSVLKDRAALLGLNMDMVDYEPTKPWIHRPHVLTVWHSPSAAPVVPGKPNPENAAYVLKLLTLATDACLQGKAKALITAPIHKEVINQAGIAFTGHTEFLADYCQQNLVVMMLACSKMKVALVTTHLPLRQVADAVTEALLIRTITLTHGAMRKDFGVPQAKIAVAGLNPHAGEGGYLGAEEEEVIIPALRRLKSLGIDVHGPFPADTLFSEEHCSTYDVFVTMYHDQGLPVLKYADFAHAVNVSLGLPIIRTSVDHGTALSLAGTGKASPSSLIAAVALAEKMASFRAS